MIYVCKICSYKYDENKEGVSWKDLPDTWVCPVCGAKKSLFEPLEEEHSESPSPQKLSRSVSDAVVETLVQCGVKWCFGMVGHSNLGFAEALRKAVGRGELGYVGIRHEGAAAFACSAYGKLTGRPAACLTIAGPGATNLLTGLADGAYKLIAAEPNAAERSRCALSAADLASDSGIFDDFMRFINISLHSSELGFTVFRLYGYPNLYDRVFEACRKQEKMPSSLGTYMRTFDCYKRKMPDSEFHKRFNWVQLMFGFAWRLNDLEPYTYPLIRYCMHCAGDAEKERKYAEMSLEIRGRMAAAYFQYAEYAMKAFARSGDTVGALKFLEPMNSRQKAYLLRRTMSDLSRNPSGLDGIVEILKSL